ncbi:vacuolar assembling/sorting protein VPS16 [Lactarius akahatsu]|uniref:Probable vacuolar protein sorting-associated protein 16 homolog n=1 Tax=Lactarius akahatsu TaxID=416441 RepID=A0AAD4LE73_9AGAM|nr:vacuolar assembling/sorting protein VPS16 [Lactarius akahatsu]
MVEHPTTSWQAMQNGNVFYRQQRLYTLDGMLPNLGDCVVAGCRNGGPLALMRDTTKLIAIGPATPMFAKSQIHVYSPSGEGLLLFGWDQAKIIRFGWTGDERLVVINEEGVYRLYDLQGDYVQFSLGTDAGEVGITDARVHESGLVALTGSLQLLEVKGWEGAKPLTLANPNLSEPPRVWTLIPPDLTISRHVEVLLSVEASVVSVDNLEAVDQRLSRGPFTHMAPSPNGKSLALLTETGMLWVVATDFQRNLAEFDTTTVVGAEGPVRQVEWCGNDAILVTWEALVLLVGPFGDTLQYFYSGPTFAVTELDGIRVIGGDTCDFIQKVPASSVSVFRPGSTSPSAILFDAWENFNNRSPKADENIRSIKLDLAAAVDEVIDAAGQEWEPAWQRKLLSAANFGKSFLDLYNANDFVNMGKTLKVLNAVRQFEVGIPITHYQYDYLSPTHLISRLTSRNLHLLALHISSFLSLPPDNVLKHWASAKITKSKPIASGTGKDAEMAGDEEVSRAIVEKFEKLGGASVSYAEIAKKAWEVGRTRLATMLLDHEPRASDQVPLLLLMKEDRLALQKAVDSGDTDLVYHVLLQLYNRLPLGAFFRLIEDGGSSLAPASRLLQVYAREQNPEMLRDFYYSDDRRVESAVLSLEESRQMKDPAAKITSIKAAQKFFSEDKERSFEAKMMDEYSRLLAFQQTLEKETTDRIEFFGLSVDETIKKCLLNGMSKRADKLKSDFKVSDRRFWYLKLHALTATRDFEGLETFSRSKRSPIGYEAFVRHLVEKGHAKEAVSYVQRCDGPKRVDLYVECGEWVMAGKECKDRGDRARLDKLRTSCPNSLIARELDQIASSMK